MFYKNLKGIYLFAKQKDKCQEKVWEKKGWSSGAACGYAVTSCGGGKGPIQQKGFFPFSGTYPYWEQSVFIYLKHTLLTDHRATALCTHWQHPVRTRNAPA